MLKLTFLTCNWFLGTNWLLKRKMSALLIWNSLLCHYKRSSDVVFSHCYQWRKSPPMRSQQLPSCNARWAFPGADLLAASKLAPRRDSRTYSSRWGRAPRSTSPTRRPPPWPWAAWCRSPTTASKLPWQPTLALCHSVTGSLWKRRKRVCFAQTDFSRLVFRPKWLIIHVSFTPRIKTSHKLKMLKNCICPNWLFSSGFPAQIVNNSRVFYP